MAGDGNWNQRGNAGPAGMSPAARQRMVEGFDGKKRELGFAVNIRQNATVLGRERETWTWNWKWRNQGAVGFFSYQLFLFRLVSMSFSHLYVWVWFFKAGTWDFKRGLPFDMIYERGQIFFLTKFL